MLCVKTQKGGYLVLVNEKYGCYLDKEGNFTRSVDNIETEVEWAKEKWQNYEEVELPLDIEQPLLKYLPYVSQYKQSLVEA